MNPNIVKNIAMDDEMDDLIIIGAALVVKRRNEENKKKQKPSCRVQPYLQGRKSKGRFAVDFEDMQNNKHFFYENFHLSPEVFQTLSELVEPYLSPKIASHPQDEISPKEKLAVVLEYFGSGSLQRHMASIYRISKQHFGKILDDVANAICVVLKEEIPVLDQAKFISIANDFNAIWNFPNCLGAIDGKHVAIKCPPNAGTLFYNYKEFHSIQLMAISDANYKFIYVDIGAHGSEGDAGVFSSCKVGQQILADTLPFPDDARVQNKKLPYYFIGDDAFPLHKIIMKPYVPRKPNSLTDEERIFNYRLSRARRCVENSFGILCSKWLCLKRTMFCNPDRAQKIIAACCYLHNYLLKTSKESYCPPKYADTYKDGVLIEGEWRSKTMPDSMFFNESNCAPIGRINKYGKFIRDQLKEYVNSPIGEVEWQRKSVFLE